ncbi:MAG: hypothetical protein IE919_18285 [Thioclava sp.]|nr:hypothetical protein [Thioclava sp.]MBD3805168.1 hypothetical protein [Thioclava sp.]
METITACENVCRDFSWFPPVIGVAANLATIAAVLLAFQQWFSWKSQRISLQKSEVALELVRYCRELQQISLEARGKTSVTFLRIPGADDYSFGAQSALELRRLRGLIGREKELLALLSEDMKDLIASLECLVSVALQYEEGLRRFGRLGGFPLFTRHEAIARQVRECWFEDPRALVEKILKESNYSIEKLAKIVRFERGLSEVPR